MSIFPDVDAPPDAELWRLGDEDFVTSMDEVTVQFRQVYAAMVSHVAEAKGRNISGRTGYKTLTEWVQTVCRVSKREALLQIANAELLRQPTGYAAVAGTLGPEHMTVIGKFLRAIPDHIGVEERNNAERILVQASAALDPTEIAGLAQEILDRMDQDGPEPSAAELRQPTRVFRSWKRRNGATGFKGELLRGASLRRGGRKFWFSSPDAAVRTMDGLTLWMDTVVVCFGRSRSIYSARAPVGELGEGGHSFIHGNRGMLPSSTNVRLLLYPALPETHAN